MPPRTRSRRRASFDRYDLVEVAVVDESERMVGVLTVDDIVDIIQQEADEDFRALAGVGDEEISDSVFEIVKSRLTWLFVNLVTAILASTVISDVRRADLENGWRWRC